MPQGQVIAIKPMSFADNSTSPEEELRLTNGGGEVEILNGKYAGQLASFEQEVDGSKISVGEKVRVRIVDTTDGRLQAKLC